MNSLYSQDHPSGLMYEHGGSKIWRWWVKKKNSSGQFEDNIHPIYLFSFLKQYNLQLLAQ
jgi:hypothetical protein